MRGGGVGCQQQPCFLLENIMHAIGKTGFHIVQLSFSSKDSV